MSIDIEEVKEKLSDLYDNTARGHEPKSKILFNIIEKALEKQQARIKELETDLKMMCIESQVAFKHNRNCNGLARDILINTLSKDKEL